MLKNYPTIPENTLDTLRSYVVNGIRPGGFLTGIITDDLNKTCREAAGDNKKAVVSIWTFLFQKMPSSCWGSTKKMREWNGLRSKEEDVKYIKIFEEYRETHYE